MAIYNNFLTIQGSVKREIVYDNVLHICGYIRGNSVYNEDNKLVGYISGNTVENTKLFSSVIGFLDGKYILDCNRNVVGRCDGDIKEAAALLLLLK